MKLCQVLAIKDSVQKQEYSDLTKAHHTLDKTAPFNGFLRTFKPRNDEGTVYPAETQVVQKNAHALVGAAAKSQAELLNVLACIDIGNQTAKGDIVVDGTVIAAGVPVHFLITLEKTLINLRTFVSKLPLLDPSKEWSYDANRGLYATQPESKVKTKKVHSPLVKYQATVEHPAQVEVIMVDEIEGFWNQVDLSSAYTHDDVQKLLAKISKLEQAVKFAREQANSIEVEKVSIGNSVMSFIFDS